MIDEILQKQFAVNQTVLAWKEGKRQWSEMDDEELLACFRSVFGYKNILNIVTVPRDPADIRREQLEELKQKMQAETKKQTNGLSMLFA